LQVIGDEIASKPAFLRMRITDISHRGGFLSQGNVYLPHIAVIEKIIDETPAVRTFHFNFKDEKLRE